MLRMQHLFSITDIPGRNFHNSIQIQYYVKNTLRAQLVKLHI